MIEFANVGLRYGQGPEILRDLSFRIDPGTFHFLTVLTRNGYGSEGGRVDSLKLTFSVVSLRIGEQSYDVTGHVSQTAPLEKVRVQTTGDQVKKVGAGALIGALAGQLLGKNTRSTVIGAGVGAAAGAAVAAGTADYDGCIPAAANLTIGLDAPLRIKLLPN